MLAGLAQVLPKNVWQYVVQIPRMAALGTKFVLQGGTQYNLAARQGAGRLHQGARARAPRCSSTRTPARPARSARRWRRCASSKRKGGVDLHRHRCGDRPRVHGEERRGDASATSARTSASARFIDTKTPGRRARAATSRASPARRGRSSRRRRCSRSSPSARRSMKQFPNLVDYEAKRAFRHFYDPRADARGGHAGQGRGGREGLLRHRARRRSQRPFQRSSHGVAGQARAHGAHRHPARAQHLLDRRRSSGPTSRRSASRSRTSSSATRRPRRCGSRAASTARSIPATRRRSRRRTSTTCSSTSTRGERRSSSTSSSPASRTCTTSSNDTMDNGELPDRRGRAGGDEGGVHEGDRLLRRRAASSTSIRRSRSSSRRCMARQHVRDLRARASASPRTRATSRAERRGRRSTIVRRRTRRRRGARSSRRSRTRTASRS